MRGIVSSVRYSNSPDEQVYCIVDLDSAKPARFRSKIVLKEGEQVDFEAEGGVIGTAALSFKESPMDALRKKVDAMAKSYASNDAYAAKASKLDAVTKKMWPRLSESAQLLIRKLMLGAPIIVRFHNDADGSSGAYGLYKSLQDLSKRCGAEFDGIMWKMHRTVFYSAEDASSDVLMANNYGSVEKPLLLVIDFGTALESNAGLELVKEKFDVIWLDHHPIVEGFMGLELDHYTNPWRFGGDSNYTAGFLACAFSKTFSDVDTADLEQASFIGDYSEYASPDDKSRRLSMLLDLLTSDTRIATGIVGSNLTPERIDEIVRDKDKSEELVGYAKNKLSEAIDSALKSVKMYKAGDVKIFVADFKNVREDESARYPLPGRFASKLLDKVQELNAEQCIVVLHFSKFISVRVGKEISARVNLLGIISEMKKSYTGIDSGGGHMSAGTMKVLDESDRNQIMRRLVDQIKKNVGA